PGRARAGARVGGSAARPWARSRARDTLGRGPLQLRLLGSRAGGLVLGAPSESEARRRAAIRPRVLPPPAALRGLAGRRAGRGAGAPQSAVPDRAGAAAVDERRSPAVH